MATKEPATPVSVEDVKRPVVNPDDLKREQEKGGKDPAGEAVEPTEKIKPVDVAPGAPYPTGSPPDPEAAFEAAHGFKRAKE